MKNVWVYKFNGTIQCDPETAAIPLEIMRLELEKYAGAENVLAMKTSTRIMPALCGMPTGAINTYELTPAGWYQLEHGVLPNPGFMLLEDAKMQFSGSDSVGQIIGALIAENPQLIRDLPGHPLRVYQTGDPITKDWRPDRFNIERSADNRIVQVWFG